MITFKMNPRKIVASISLVTMLVTQLFSGVASLVPVVHAASNDGICNIGDVTINPPTIGSYWNGTQNVTVTFDDGDCASTVNMQLQYNSPTKDGVTWNPINTVDGVGTGATRVVSFNTTSTYGGDTVQDSNDYVLRLVAGTDLI